MGDNLQLKGKKKKQVYNITSQLFPNDQPHICVNSSHVSSSSSTSSGVAKKQKRRLSHLEKPVIYFYSNQDMDVTVKLEILDKGEQFTFLNPPPTVRNGNEILWPIQLKANSQLFSLEYTTCGVRRYSELFWEASFSGISLNHFLTNLLDVVPRLNLITYLENILPILGLNEYESNQFINFWAPRMIKYEYTRIRFSQEFINLYSKLNVHPRPDLLLRVFMLWNGYNTSGAANGLQHLFGSNISTSQTPNNKELRTQLDQSLLSSDNPTFVVVEWGGIEIKS
jgi:hypothetical protein